MTTSTYSVAQVVSEVKTVTDQWTTITKPNKKNPNLISNDYFL